jgi:hypothetical protein
LMQVSRMPGLDQFQPSAGTFRAVRSHQEFVRKEEARHDCTDNLFDTFTHNDVPIGI